MTLPYDLFALLYAETGARAECENMMGGSPSAPGDRLAYYVWLARRGDELWLVDTGFGAEAAARRGRNLLARPARMLERLGIAPAQITNVVLTHLHYDHAGTMADFPYATFHLQAREAAFATGPAMCHAAIRHGYEVEDVVAFVRRLYADRVRFHDGDAELAPGLSLHAVPGHTPGLQVVRVATARGHVLLASDATHFYANFQRGTVFPVVVEPVGVLEGYRRLLALADTPDHIVPGHDPRVAQIYPAVAEGIVRLDVAPAAGWH